MSINSGEIQPIDSKPWVVPTADSKEVQAIPPVAKAEGGTTKSVGGDQTGSGNKSASGSDPNVDAQIAQQVNSYLQESSDVELSYQQDGKGKMVVQVLDKSTGQVIRQIPPQNLLSIRQKLDDLSGILFDDKV